MKRIAGALAGLVLGAGLALAAERQAALGEPESALLEAWRELPTDAASLNRKERFLQALVEQLAPLNGSSLYNLAIQRGFAEHARRYLGERELRVLELGPGINLGSGLAFCLFGAAKYYGLDLYTDPDFYGAPQYQAIVRLLEAVAPQLVRTPAAECAAVADDRISFNEARIEYLAPRESWDIPLPDGSLDYVFSNAVLDHVTDPQRTAEAIARVLASGGLTAHQIDLRDHRDFSAPLEFLKEDEAAWQARGQGPGYTNRWRASDFRAAFERAGLEVLELDAQLRRPVDEALRRSLDPKFQRYSLEDLSILGMRLVARKR
jgi:SAM-dependent methyltransferase